VKTAVESIAPHLRKNNLIIIEWPENVKEILPENHLKIFCEFVDESSREFKF